MNSKKFSRRIRNRILTDIVLNDTKKTSKKIQTYIGRLNEVYLGIRK